MSLFIAAVAMALSVSAICSLLEATLLSLTPAQVADLTRRHPRMAPIWQRFKSNIEQPIAAILILNTVAHTMGASISGAEFERLWGERWLFGFSILLTYLMLQFTEILPKTIGVRYNARLAPLIAYPLNAIERLMRPVLYLVHFVNRPFARPPHSRGGAKMLDEITALASMARTAGAIDARQSRMIQAASLLSEVRACQIMTPHTEVAFLTFNQSADEVLAIIQRHPYTRFPVCKTNLDDVVGMIHVRDLFNQLEMATAEAPHNPAALPERLRKSSRFLVGAGEIDLHRLVRNVLTVPESMPVVKLLQRFQESRVHMAIVVDEYGATTGVATLEDVLEEVVGEIEDEMDRPHAHHVVDLGGGVFQANGRVSLHELSERVGASIEDEEANTLSGLIQKKLGRFAKAGDEVLVGRFKVRVLDIERRRVGSVELQRLD